MHEAGRKEAERSRTIPRPALSEVHVELALGPFRMERAKHRVRQKVGRPAIHIDGDGSQSLDPLDDYAGVKAEGWSSAGACMPPEQHDRARAQGSQASIRRLEAVAVNEGIAEHHRISVLDRPRWRAGWTERGVNDAGRWPAGRPAELPEHGGTFPFAPQAEGYRPMVLPLLDQGSPCQHELPIVVRVSRLPVHHARLCVSASDVFRTLVLEAWMHELDDLQLLCGHRSSRASGDGL